MTTFYNDIKIPENVEIYNLPVLEIPSTDEQWEARRKRWEERRWLGEPEVIADDWLFETYTLED